MAHTISGLSDANQMTNSPINWITGTPMLPPPALSPSAQPLRRCGKNALMLVIDDAKLPPPRPVSAAAKRNQPNPNLPGFSISINTRVVGISRTTAEKIAQLRPPNLAVAVV